MELTDKNFEEEVIDSDGLVFVDFWGSWCTACQQMEPVVKKLEEKYDGKIKIGYLNIDKNPQTATKFEIEETPTHIFFKNGEVVERKMGALAGKQLEKIFEKLLNE